MLIDEVMTRYPATVRPGTTVRDAAALLTTSEVGMLMVSQADGRFVGILTETDLLAAVLPTGDEIKAVGSSLDAAFGAFVTKGSEVADRTIDRLVVRDPVTIGRGVEVAAAAVVLLDRGLRRVPVLEGTTVVGTVSRSDLCRAVLAHARPTAASTAAPATAPATPAEDTTPASSPTTAPTAAPKRTAAPAARRAAAAATPAARATGTPRAGGANAARVAAARLAAARARAAAGAGNA